MHFFSSRQAELRLLLHLLQIDQVLGGGHTKNTGLRIFKTVAVPFFFDLGVDVVGREGLP